MKPIFLTVLIFAFKFSFSQNKIGGYEVAVGLAYATSGNYNSEVAWIDVAIGGVCLGIIPKREERFKMHLRKAVELYNDALELPEN